MLPQERDRSGDGVLRRPLVDLEDARDARRQAAGDVRPVDVAAAGGAVVGQAVDVVDVGGRLAKKLLELAASHGVPRPDGVLLDLPLTQEELANMLGVTRESVNRHLSSLRRQGAVSREGRRFLIRDAEALRRYIG